MKSSRETALGPGPNWFSDDSSNVWVDDSGRLHLRITRRADGLPLCAEVIAETSIGYGTYRFYLDTPVSRMDANAVLGLFTWSDAPDFDHREIDIEFSRWGSADDLNAQYVVQQQVHRFDFECGAAERRLKVQCGARASARDAEHQSTHVFDWRPGAVDFSSFRGHVTAPGDLVQAWSTFDSVPVAGDESPRINLWMAEGKAPEEEVEVIVARVDFSRRN